MCSWLMLLTPALSAQVEEQSMPILAWDGVNPDQIVSTLLRQFDYNDIR